MRQWQDIMRRVVETGVRRPDRTGTGTRALFGEQLVFENTGQSFPAVTTKKLAFRQCMAELACFIRGYDSLEQFHDMGCTIWDANGNAPYWEPRFPSDVGRIYGVLWRNWQSFNRHGQIQSTDQLQNLVDGLKKDPFSRRHLMISYNPGELDQVCLPGCHVLCQAFAYQDGAGIMCLDLRVDLRSIDLFLGLPFDVASYAVLQRLLACECGMLSKRLILQLGDAHIYLNHADQVNEVLSRKPLPPPQLHFNHDTTLFGFHPDDVALLEYNNHGSVAAPMNV